MIVLEVEYKYKGKAINEHEKLIKAGVAEYDIDYYYRAWY